MGTRWVVADAEEDAALADSDPLLGARGPYRAGSPPAASPPINEPHSGKRTDLPLVSG